MKETMKEIFFTIRRLNDKMEVGRLHERILNPKQEIIDMYFEKKYRDFPYDDGKTYEGK